MRLAVLCAVVLLLPGCTWMRQQLGSPAPAIAPPVAAPAATRPETPRPTKPKPRAERPAAAQQTQSQPQAATPTPPIDYGARCHAMAANRADDARQLGASPADQAKMESDVYRDCMAQSVK